MICRNNNEIGLACEKLVVLINQGVVDLSSMCAPADTERVYAAIERVAFLYPAMRDNLIGSENFNFGDLSIFFDRKSDLTLVSDVIEKLTLIEL